MKLGAATLIGIILVVLIAVLLVAANLGTSSPQLRAAFRPNPTFSDPPTYSPPPTGACYREGKNECFEATEEECREGLDDDDLWVWRPNEQCRPQNACERIGALHWA